MANLLLRKATLLRVAYMAGVLFSVGVCVLSLVLTVRTVLAGAAGSQIAGVPVLRCGHVGKPLLSCLVAAAAALRLLHPSLFARIAGYLDLRRWVVLALLGVAGFCGLAGQHRIHGDGREYILQTQAIVFDGTLKIDTNARRDYWNATNPYGITLGDTSAPARQLSENAQAGN